MVLEAGEKRSTARFKAVNPFPAIGPYSALPALKITTALISAIAMNMPDTSHNSAAN